MANQLLSQVMADLGISGDPATRAVQQNYQLNNDMSNIADYAYTSNPSWQYVQNSLGNAAANSGEFADETAYQLAYALAVNDGRAKNDNQLKGLTDYYFDEIGHSDNVQGSDFRPDSNPFYDAVAGAKTGLDNINTTLGGGIDWIIDNPVAGVAGWATGDQQLAQNMRDATSGESLAWIPSVAEDVALSAIPGVGIPLVLAKNAVEDSDQLYNAVYGRDAVSGADLTDQQRAAAGAGFAADLALSAIPGAKLGTKAGGKILSGAVKQGEKNADDAAKALLTRAGETDTQATTLLDNAMQAEEGLSGAAAKAASADTLEEAVAAEALAKSLREQAASRSGSYFDEALANLNKANGGMTVSEAQNVARNLTDRSLNPFKSIPNRVNATHDLMPYLFNRGSQAATQRLGGIGTNSARNAMLADIDAAVGKAGTEAAGKAAGKAAEKAGTEAAEKAGTEAAEKAGAEATESAAGKVGEETAKRGGIMRAIDTVFPKGSLGPHPMATGLAGNAINLANVGAQLTAQTGEDLPTALSDLYKRVQVGDWSAALPLAMALAPGPRRRVSKSLGGSVPYYALRGDIANEAVGNYYDPGALSPDQQRALEYLMQQGQQNYENAQSTNGNAENGRK